MKFTDNFQKRHAILDLNNMTALFTSPNPENEFRATIIKVPTYSIKHEYTEKICEGNSWYSNGRKLTNTVTYDNHYLCIKDNECIGLFILQETKSGKIPLLKLDSFTEVKNFLKTL